MLHENTVTYRTQVLMIVMCCRLNLRLGLEVCTFVRILV